MKLKYLALIFLLLAIVLVAGCSKKAASAEFDGRQITVFKTESCGCCDLYVRYLDNQGFDVEVQQVDDLTPVKQKHSISQNLQSCHTVIIGNYFVEGHVPSEAIQKLLAEKPEIAGIALPGMPSGSPGMPGSKQEKWTIYAVGKDGSVTEFMKI